MNGSDAMGSGVSDMNGLTSGRVNGCVNGCVSEEWWSEGSWLPWRPPVPEQGRGYTCIHHSACATAPSCAPAQPRGAAGRGLRCPAGRAWSPWRT